MAPPDLISLFVAPLNELGVTYMVTGFVASSTYSHVRLANDVDIVAVLSDAEASKLHAAFNTPAFQVPPLEVMSLEWRRPAHGHFNPIHILHATSLLLSGNGTADPIPEHKRVSSSRPVTT